MTGPSQLPMNPTSMGKTIYLCMMMSLLALNHLLDDHPRHVQYRKTQQHDKASANRDDTVRPGVANGESASRSGSFPEQHHHPSPADPKTKWPYPRNKTRREDGPGGATKPGDATASRPCMTPTKAQMSDAWSRMRAATKIPGGPTKRVTTRTKRVSWGDMEVFRYDEQAEVAGIVEYDSTNAVVDGESE